MKRSRINEDHKAIWDDADPIADSFAKLYVRYKRETTNGNSGKDVEAFNAATTILKAKGGFAGSGHVTFVYQHGEVKYRVEVSKGANGKGFWGTDHFISVAGVVVEEEV